MAATTEAPEKPLEVTPVPAREGDVITGQDKEQDMARIAHDSESRLAMVDRIAGIDAADAAALMLHDPDRPRPITEAGGVAQTVNRRPNSLEDAEAIVERGVDAFGSVDLLVVASGFNQAGFIHEQDLADWEKVMDANVRGAWLMAQAFGKRALDQKTGGKVLFISSVRGRHGNFSGYTAYCTSKGATDALTRSLATEWAQYGITVNAIAPTVFRSGVTAWMFGDNELGLATRKRSLARIPLGRLGEVDDLLGMAIYLLSPASDFCTGQVMYVDGGYTAG